MKYFELHVQNLWWYFLCCLVICVACSFFMYRQAKHFKCMRGVAVTRFSIMDIQFPGTSFSVSNIILGINKLPKDRNQTLNALRNSLLLDFLFMAGLYPAIFLLCMNMALRMQSTGKGIFLVLAWLQGLAWLCDILENIYVLRKMIHPVPARERVNMIYKGLVKAKWAIASLGAFCSIFGLLYYWMSGFYNDHFIIVGLILLSVTIILMCYFIVRVGKAIANN